ncbi:hypothetical protein [Halanaerobacter jeridensis]|uniref:Uncharacterized protein n=1 Tax=Halanaerobacter jeridensis TaxID=706427 RepID=A0A938XVM2_9FIRM|nr:hypothetical protein [Halanaerobacter jeridensis]MBM7556427.1 hypothetical protein [Halanaerobacter jeridensis]
MADDKVTGEDLELNESNDNYRIIKGKFKYGKFEDEVGMFMAIIGSEELKSWNLIMTDNPEAQLTPVDGDYIIFKRIFDGNTIKEKKRSYNFKYELKDKLEDSVERLTTATKQEIEKFFDRELHILAKERIKLDLATEEISAEKLENDMPQMFHNEEDQELEEEVEDESTVVQCSVIIAPINGQKIANINIGDEILLEFSGAQYEKYKEDLAEVIEEENKVVGTLEEVNYDQEEDSYILLVHFTSEIYGKTSMDANNNMKLKVPYQQEEVEIEQYKDVPDLMISLMLAALAILVIILLLMKLF